MNKKLNIISPKKEHCNEGTKKIKELIEINFRKDSLKFNKEITHIIIGGFLDAFKYQKYAKKQSTILHLISNIDFSFKKTLICFREDLSVRRSAPRIINNFLNLASSLIPLYIKKIPLLKFHRIIVPTNYLKSKLGNGKNISVVPIGVSLKKFKNLNRHSEGVAYFAASSSSKGFNDLYVASKYLSNNIPIKFYFSIRYNLMKKRLIGDNIKVFGKVQNINKAYNENSIIVLPFRTKNSSIGIPLTLLEAMACERAIITTNLPHIKEVCKNSVIYVNPLKPKEIAKAINKLNKNPKLRKKLGKLARQRVKQFYSHKIMIKKLKEVYTVSSS